MPVPSSHPGPPGRRTRGVHARPASQQRGVQDPRHRGVRHDEGVLQGRDDQLHLHQGLLLRCAGRLDRIDPLRGGRELPEAADQGLRPAVHHGAAGVHRAADDDGLPERPGLRRPPGHHRPATTREGAQAAVPQAHRSPAAGRSAQRRDPRSRPLHHHQGRRAPRVVGRSDRGRHQPGGVQQDPREQVGALPASRDQRRWDHPGDPDQPASCTSASASLTAPRPPRGPAPTRRGAVRLLDGWRGRRGVRHRP